MKVLVTGVNGQLGHDVVNELLSRGIEAVGSDITPEYAGLSSIDDRASYVKMDITDDAEVSSVMEANSVDAVIHCAAWTQVDKAEEDECRELVYRINHKGTENIAKLCGLKDIKLMYISTDYIFNGLGDAPWTADCDDYEPLNVYGDSKLKGELAVKDYTDRFFIVRIAWVFGVNGNNFIKTMLNVGKKFDTLKVVKDQIGTPTYTLDLARLLVDMIVTDKYGVYHATNEGGYISWYDFACEIFRQAGYTVTVNPVTTEEYGISKAKRPFNSRLDKSKLVENGFEPLPDWKDALSRYLSIIKVVE